MKLYWHIGPHKTGTSSLQFALAAHAESGQASYYYPPAPEHGPGHAGLAWRFLGLNGRPNVPGAVFEEIERAESLGFSKVVLSSEEFSRALVAHNSFQAFAAVCDKVECELVITLRPISERIHPELQELIKHGLKLRYDSVHELTAAFDGRPGLRPDFLSAAIEGSGAASCSVILTNHQNPQKLFDGISTVLGERIPPGRDPQANVSYPFIKTSWLEVINRYGGVPPEDARDAVDAAFQAASRHLDKLLAVPYPPLSPALQHHFENLWNLQLAYLRALEGTGRIRCL